MDIFVSVGRYLLPALAFLVLLNCMVYLMKGNKKPHALGILVNSANGDKIPLTSYETSIGRSKSCDIVLGYSTVSRFHAVLSKRKKGWLLSDTGSKTGVYVNSEKIDNNAAVKNGDTIIFGTAVFSFYDNSPAPPVESIETKAAAPLQTEDKYFTGEINLHFENDKSYVLENMVSGEQIEITGQTCLIGRSDEAQVQMDFPAVSRFHTLLTRDESGFVVEDLNSKSGTLLNGRPLVEISPIEDGDVIEICGVKLVFRVYTENE